MMVGKNKIGRLLIMALLLVMPQLSVCSQAARGQDVVVRGATKLLFASREEASKLLSTRDDFVSRLSPFDRGARLKTDQPVDEASYLKFVAQQALDWTDEEKAAIVAAFKSIDGELLKLKMKLPATISMIKTTGAEEGNAAYTRGAAIVIPQSKVKETAGAGAGLAPLMAHELFHVLSRHDVELRERLYKSIGFERCPELKLPDNLAARRLTNPDAPINDHFIKLKVDGQELAAIPVLYANAETYDKQRGGEFFNYLVFEFMAIDRASPQSTASSTGAPAFSQPQMKDGQPLLIKPTQAGGFIDQVGRNTQYLIHPDEILADNFMFIVTRSEKIKSPEVLARIAACFQ